jgi:hypothetical protein
MIAHYAALATNGPLGSRPPARSSTALNSPHPKIRLPRRNDAKPTHPLDRRASYSPIRSTRLTLFALRTDALDLPAIYKSP